MPHCDTLDGPVVKSALKALETGNVNYCLIWVPEEAEKEVKEAFAKTLAARKTGKEAQEVADLWFFETVVRLHRAGEGEGFTGLKPAGLDEGPVVPQAEKAIETGNCEKVVDFIENAVEDDLKRRFQKVMDTKNYSVDDVKAGREHIEAFINFVVFAHHLYTTVSSHTPVHGEESHSH